MPTDHPLQDDTEPSGNTPLRMLAEQKAGALDVGDTVEVAGDRLRANHADAWPVAEDRKLVGMVTDGNPDRKMGGSGHDPKAWKVGEIMNHELVFCYEDEDCAAARTLMDERALSFLPVVDRQMRIVGIFSREEIDARTAGSLSTIPEP